MIFYEQKGENKVRSTPWTSQNRKNPAAMALQDEILKQSKQIKTDSYPMSIGELLNLYRDNELDVHPEFQRVFRWTDTQKTRLIESILLGIPIPPIFVAQRTDGVWDVVDGVQRLSTILQFVGVLKDEDEKLVTPLVLEETKFLPSLKNKKWPRKKSEEDDQSEDTDVFTPDQQRYIKRAKIDMNIVLKESDERSKYELFMRLNTGGSALTPQEVRNCLMIMAYPETYEWINELSKSSDFADCTSLSENDVKEQYPMELVTRFLAFRKVTDQDLKEVRDIGDYLNDALESLNVIAKNKKKRETEERAFLETFRLLDKHVGENAFRRFNREKNKFQGPFSIASFEVVALGIGFNIQDGRYPFADKIEEKVKSIWDSRLFIKNSGSGVRASIRIPKIVPMGRELFSK